MAHLPSWYVAHPPKPITSTLSIERTSDGTTRWSEAQSGGELPRDPRNREHKERIGHEKNGFSVYYGTDVPYQRGHICCPEWLRDDYEQRKTRSELRSDGRMSPPPNIARKRGTLSMAVESDHWGAWINATEAPIGEEPAESPNKTCVSSTPPPLVGLSDAAGGIAAFAQKKARLRDDMDDHIASQLPPSQVVMRCSNDGQLHSVRIVCRLPG